MIELTRAQKAELQFWKAIFSSIPLTMKVFLRRRMGGQTMKVYMPILASLYTWLLLSAFGDKGWFWIPDFQISSWGIKASTFRELLIYLVPVLCLYQWVTRGRDYEASERGKSLVWNILKSDRLRETTIRQWLDPLIPVFVASLFYSIDFRLFLFFFIGGVALFIEEAIYNFKERKQDEIRKATIGRERRRRGLNPTGGSTSDEARPIELVKHEEQAEFNQSSIKSHL